MHPEDQPRKTSDFERFQEERRRYASAKREARLLKSGSFYSEEDGLIDHPWAVSSAKAKRANEANVPSFPGTQPKRSAKRRLALTGVALICFLGLALYSTGSWRDNLRPGEAVTKPSDHAVIWHDVSEHEARLLNEYSRGFLAGGDQDPGVHIDYVPDIPLRLRVTPFVDWPSIIVTDVNTASVLASAGWLQPLVPLGEATPPTQQFWLPLSPASPWARPIVVAVPRGPSTGTNEHGMSLTYYLVEQIRSQEVP